MVTAQYILDEIDIETTGLNDYDPEKPLWGNVTHHPNQSIALNPKEIKEKRVPSVSEWEPKMPYIYWKV